MKRVTNTSHILKYAFKVYAWLRMATKGHGQSHTEKMRAHQKTLDRFSISQSIIHTYEKFSILFHTLKFILIVLFSVISSKSSAYLFSCFSFPLAISVDSTAFISILLWVIYILSFIVIRLLIGWVAFAQYKLNA